MAIPEFTKEGKNLDKLSQWGKNNIWLPQPNGDWQCANYLWQTGDNPDDVKYIMNENPDADLDYVYMYLEMMNSDYLYWCYLNEKYLEMYPEEECCESNWAHPANM